MKLEDLRVGNLVFNNNGELHTITEINSETLNKIKPIPLEKENLWVWGFKTIGYKTKDYYKNGFFLHNRKRGLVIKKSIPPLKYLHELQNAYYIFKGYELI